MKFQQCLWDLEEQEPQEISQDECAQIYNGEPIYYFGNIDNEQQDQEQFKQAKQQLIELLEKVTNTIPDYDPDATDQQGNPKPINKQHLIDFKDNVQSSFNYYDISSDIKKALLNWIKKQLEDLYINHSSRLKQAKGFSTDKLELDVCWQGVLSKFDQFIDSVRVDSSLSQLVVTAKSKMLFDLASAYCASKTSNGISGVHFAGYYFNSLARSYGLIPISWESSDVNDPDDFLKYVHDHQDNAFWEKLIALIDDFFPQELGDGISPFERVRELMDEVVPKDDNNSAWLRFFMGDVTEETSLSSGLEEQTRQRLARLCTSYMMAQQGYLSPDYCRTLKVKVVDNSNDNQNRAESIEVLSSKRLLPDHEQWSQNPSDQPGGDQEVSDNHNIEAVYYYLTSEDIFIHIDGVIRPASQADLMLIKDDLKNYQLRVPAANLQYLDRDFILELNCLPSITMPSLGISLSSDSQKLLEVLASDHALKNYIKQQFIHHHELLMMDIEGVNPDPNYKIKSPLLHTLFWQLYQDNSNHHELTNDDSQCLQLLTGCQGITTFGKLNDWLKDNTDHPLFSSVAMLRYIAKMRSESDASWFFRLVINNLINNGGLRDGATDHNKCLINNIKELLSSVNQERFNCLIQVSLQGIINSLEGADDVDDRIHKIAQFLTYSVKQGSASILEVITRHKQWRFFWDLLDNDSSIGLVVNLFANDRASFSAFLKDDYNGGFVDVLTEKLTDEQFHSLLLSDLSGFSIRCRDQACLVALANNHQAFLRRLFRLQIQQILGSFDYSWLHVYSIRWLFVNHENDNEVHLITQALSQGIIDSLEETNDSDLGVRINKLAECLSLVVGSCSHSVLDIIIQYKQWHFFSELLNNDRSQDLVFALFKNNQKQLDLFLQDKDNYDSLNALVKQLTDEQFIALFIKVNRHRIHDILDTCQKMPADNQLQAFLQRCFRLIIQEQAISDNFKVRNAAHQNINMVFKQLGYNTNNNEGQMTSLTRALANAIITYVNNISHANLSIDTQRIVWLLLRSDSLITETEYSLIHNIIQYQQVNFFNELLQDNVGREVVLKLLGIDKSHPDQYRYAPSIQHCCSLMLNNDNCRHFLKILTNQLYDSELMQFLENSSGWYDTVVKDLLKDGHNEFLNILNELKPDWTSSLLHDSDLSGMILRSAAEVDNPAILDTYADLIHDNHKIEDLLENYNVLYFAFSHQHSTEFTQKLFRLWPDIATRIAIDSLPKGDKLLPEGVNVKCLTNPLSLIFVEDNAAQLQCIHETLNNPAQLKACLQKPVFYTGKFASLGSSALCSLKQGKPDKDNSEVLRFLSANYSELTKGFLTEKASFNRGSPILEMFKTGMSPTDFEAIKTYLGADFFKHSLTNAKDRNNENVLHYALKGYELGDKVCQQPRITNSINTLFAEHPDIVKDLLKKPSKSEWGYFSRGETPLYHIVQKGYHEVLASVTRAVGADEFLKLLRTENKAFQDILLSMCQYRNDNNHSIDCLKDFLSQFGAEHVDQLLLNDGGENNKIIMNLSKDLSGYCYDDEVKKWYSSVFHQLDQHATIMPTLLMQKRTADSMPYWQAFQSQGLIDDDLNERLKMDSTEKIQVHMKSLLTVLSKQRDVAASKRNQAQQYLGELDNINAQGDNAHEDLKKLFERMVIQMGKHQFWRQGINANKTSSAVNMDQLPDTLRQFYGHFDRIRQQAFGISDQQWCGLLKGERPRHNLSNNLNVSSSPHGTFGSGHGQQPPEPQLESEQSRGNNFDK